MEIIPSNQPSQRIPLEPEPSLPLTDAHCHLPYGRLPKNPDLSFERQVDRFVAAGGQYLVTSSIDLNSLHQMQDFIRDKKRMRLAIGFAPQTITYTPSPNLETEFKNWIVELKTAVKENPQVVAIGEIGLDFHHAKTLKHREHQIQYFRAILEQTLDLGKPYMLHVRNPTEADLDRQAPQHPYNHPDAVNEIILKTLTEFRVAPERVMWHCFSGPVNWGSRLTQEGYILSVPSSAFGFKRWRKNIENIPVKYLLTETDSSFQHPYDMGAYNEPVNVKYAVATLAYLHQKPQLDIATEVLQNFQNFFAIS